jgi:hypothetical protein
MQRSGELAEILAVPDESDLVPESHDQEADQPLKSPVARADYNMRAAARTLARDDGPPMGPAERTASIAAARPTNVEDPRAVRRVTRAGRS